MPLLRITQLVRAPWLRSRRTLRQALMIPLLLARGLCMFCESLLRCVDCGASTEAQQIEVMICCVCYQPVP